MNTNNSNLNNNDNQLSLYKNLETNINGVSIKVAGRLSKQRVVPRQTIKLASQGVVSNSFFSGLNSKSRLKNVLSYSFSTNKNKKGSNRISVYLSHSLPKS